MHRRTFTSWRYVPSNRMKWRSNRCLNKDCATILSLYLSWFTSALLRFWLRIIIRFFFFLLIQLRLCSFCKLDKMKENKGNMCGQRVVSAGQQLWWCNRALLFFMFELLYEPSVIPINDLNLFSAISLLKSLKSFFAKKNFQ